METGGWFLIVGSLVFGVGAAIGVPGVFMLADAEARLALLERRMTYWRLGQPLYSVGPLIVALGVGLLAFGTSDDLAMGLFVSASVLMLAGVTTWSYDCYLRGTHPAEFAYGTLPGWPFAVYVAATIAGLALMAAGLAASNHSPALYGGVLAADVLFLGFYAATRDIPPFFFYTLLLAAGIALVAGSGR